VASSLSLPPFLSAASVLKIMVSEAEMLLPFLPFLFVLFFVRSAVLFLLNRFRLYFSN
jgi:hypothetical protein